MAGIWNWYQIMNNGRDRISELPDAVLCHILSFLETKWAVRTTALSQRWKNLVWNSLSTLHFDESSFPKQYRFKEFIDRVLARRDKTDPLHKLVYITNKVTSSKSADNLIDYAMTDALQHLQLCIPGGFRGIERVLNSQIFPMSLRVLKLGADGSGLTVIDTLFCLPKLEILHLQWFPLGQNLLSKCENLVELSIVSCRMRSSEEKLRIRAPELKTLNISYLCVSCSRNPPKVMLMVPKLTAFKLKAKPDGIPVIDTDEFLHLKTAILKTSEKIEKPESMMNILQKLCHAHHVSLSLPTLQLLHQIGRALEVPVSPFSNLKTFRITTKEKNKYGHVIMQHKDVSVSVINQVLNTIFQRSSSDVESFVHLSRQSKRPRI